MELISESDPKCLDGRTLAKLGHEQANQLYNGCLEVALIPCRRIGCICFILL
jgi:hypothetical protein